MGEDGSALRAVEMLGKPDARARFTQQTGQGRAAGFPGMWPQVLATVEAKLAAPDYKIEIMVIAAR